MYCVHNKYFSLLLQQRCFTERPSYIKVKSFEFYITEAISAKLCVVSHAWIKLAAGSNLKLTSVRYWLLCRSSSFNVIYLHVAVLQCVSSAPNSDCSCFRNAIDIFYNYGQSNNSSRPLRFNILTTWRDLVCVREGIVSASANTEVTYKYRFY